MTKKILMVLVITAIVTGGVFAQALNTVTFDFGPTIFGSAFRNIADDLEFGEEGFSTSGFGLAAQYERRMFDNVTVGGKLGYLGIGITLSDEDEVDNIETKVVFGTDIYSFTLEGHARYYVGRRFFVNGMLGLATLSTKFSGEFIYTDEFGDKYVDKGSYTETRFYLNAGVKIGWQYRIPVVPSTDVALVFEPSFGYYTGIGLGKTMGQRLAASIGGNSGVASDLDEAYAIFEDFIFIGGPRVSIAFGFSF
ncbi:MAG: hypothetical protein LBC80_06125 [Treponema sp.]|jgi:hypothetical protein|nr:hypothetical protein [Treponema sp.]